MDKVEINIPFDGFYESFYSKAIDYEEERFIEYRLEEEDINTEQSHELAELLFYNTNYRQAYAQIAVDYTEAFNEKFKEWTDVDLQLELVTMTSPREYNFTTDRIFAKASLSALCLLRGKVDEELLRKIIRERFTSYDGFISHYSNSLEDWEADGEGVLSWDYNQFCTLLMCFLPEDWRWEMYDEAFYNDEACRAWEAAVDWPPIEEFLERCKENHEQV